MRNPIVICLMLLLAVSNLPLRAASTPESVSVAWQDLAATAQGKTIALVLPNGVHLRGKVLGVDAAKMRMHIDRTSDKQAFPKGDTDLPRASVRSFTMTRNRTLWKIAAPLIGLGAGLAIAIPVNAYAHNEGDGAPLAVAAIIAVPTALGYLLGRSLDRKTVSVTVRD